MTPYLEALTPGWSNIDPPPPCLKVTPHPPIPPTHLSLQGCPLPLPIIFHKIVAFLYHSVHKIFHPPPQEIDMIPYFPKPEKTPHPPARFSPGWGGDKGQG
eukprot:764213-Hanusia_phi.AAC.3